MCVSSPAAGEAGLALTGRGPLDATRLAASPADIWRDVCSSNAGPIASALDDLIGELQALRQGLESGTEIDRVFESAGEWRDRLVALKDAKRKP